MAGGNGSRFWPVSRNACPKQFLDIADTGKSFIRHTYERFSGFIPEENIIIVTLEKYRDLVLERIPEIRKENLLLEPYARNTAPCIAYATYTLLKRDPEAVMIATPADHIIFDQESFHKTIDSALAVASEQNVLMTLGVKPTHPDPNYGYIQVTGGNGAYLKEEAIPVKTFTEKPDTELAKVFIQSGEFFWNSGIFVWTADTIKKELEKYLPEVTGIFKGWEHALGTSIERDFIEKAYTDCVKISIDYGVMEKTEKAWLFPAKFDWADIGTWASLYSHIQKKDADGNIFTTGKKLSEGNSHIMALSTDRNKLMAIKGLEDYVIIDTDKVLLICPRDDKEFKDFIAGIAMPGYENYR